MPKFIDNNTEVDIRRLSKEGYTQNQIVKKLKEENNIVSRSSVSRILNNVGIRRIAISEGKEKPKFRRPPIKRTPGTIKKVKAMVTKENPESYRSIHKSTGLTHPIINKIIHHDLKLQTRKKSKVHRLRDEHKKNRKTTCRKLYEKHLAGDRSQYAVTLDEALVYLHNANGKRQICYIKNGETIPESWVFEKTESFDESFMVVGVITGKGTLPLFRVPSSVKINARYYIEHVLKPLFNDHLPRLYPKEMDKVFFHHDKASSHTANLTLGYLEEMKAKYGIRYMEKEDIPVKAPDASPMDFYGFGYLKQELLKRRAKTLDGVWKLSQEVWSQVTLDKIQKVFASWKRRLRMVTKKDGEHIENIKDIHNKLINLKLN